MEKDIIYKFFSDYIFEHSGIVYGETDKYRLESRIRELCKSYNVSNDKELYQLFKKSVSKEMHVNLIDTATNNETYFFRDIKPFVSLGKEVIPKLLESKGASDKIRIWSAACSKGQEIYSILMSILENNPNFPLERLEVNGTDISKSALKYAIDGQYNGQEIQRGLPITTLVKYFEQKDENNWSFKKEFRKGLSFSELNLLSEAFPRDYYDIIFCRNVLIYQNKENKSKIVEKVFRSLLPHGHLFLGAGESLIGLGQDYHQENVIDAITYRRPEAKKAAA